MLSYWNGTNAADLISHVSFPSLSSRSRRIGRGTDACNRQQRRGFGVKLFWKWKSLGCVWLFATPWLYSTWKSPGQNTGVGSHSLLKGIFPIQGLNPGLPHCTRILYQLSHHGSHQVILEQAKNYTVNLVQWGINPVVVLWSRIFGFYFPGREELACHSCRRGKKRNTTVFINLDKKQSNVHKSQLQGWE